MRTLVVPAPFLLFPVDFLELVAQRLRADALAYIRALPSFCLGWTISISLSSIVSRGLDRRGVKTPVLFITKSVITIMP